MTRAAPQQDLRGADARAASVTPAKPHAGERRVGEAADRAGDARSGLAQRGCPRRRNQADRTAARPADPACRPRADRPATVETTPVAGADDTSQLVYILPGIALTLLLAAGLGYAIRTSSRARRARISA